jgi:hypothetical protein
MESQRVLADAARSMNEQRVRPRRASCELRPREVDLPRQ